MDWGSTAKNLAVCNFADTKLCAIWEGQAISYGTHLNCNAQIVMRVIFNQSLIHVSSDTIWWKWNQVTKMQHLHCLMQGTNCMKNITLPTLSRSPSFETSEQLLFMQHLSIACVFDVHCCALNGIVIKLPCVIHRNSDKEIDPDWNHLK